ncbi:MAG: alkaline phosphatase family protein [Promethearchaeota archaeon]
MSRVVIIGIDGVPYQMIKDLSDKGIMKNFKELRKNGIFKKMKSSIPAVSSASWSTIITGKNPGEHGVYGFTDIIPGTYVLSFCHYSNLKSQVFWENEKAVILNVPSTYPVKEMNGVHISGFVSPDIERAVYPKTYLKKLKEMDYRIDIDLEKAHKSKMLLFKELFETLDKRMEACRYFWNEQEWNIFKIVFTGSDRLEHFLWDAYEDENHEYHEKFLEFFRRIDEAIGEINGMMREDDALLLLSDHGMERVKYNVNLNAWLMKNDFLKLGGEKKKYKDIEEGTKAFAMEFGRIYLNKKGKYPKGFVDKENEEKIKEEIIRKLEEMKIDGEKVIKKIHKRDDIYKGKCVEGAPDLVLIPNKGFNLRGKISENIFEESPFTGMHNPEAFLFVKNKENEKIVPEEPSVEDVVPIIKKLR